MKRLHVHVGVKDVAESIRFYSTLFGVEPTVRKPDYAKWMLEDPRVNFAITPHHDAPGVSHLGIQVDTDDELREISGRLAEAERAIVEQRNATCCYARGDKTWADDPQGISWETFHTFGESETFGKTGAPRREQPAAGCCGAKTAS